MASQAQQAMLDKLKTQVGFIAALDQSGGSTQNTVLTKKCLTLFTKCVHVLSPAPLSVASVF